MARTKKRYVNLRRASHRMYSDEFKLDRLKEWRAGGSPSAIAREHGFKTNLIYRWNKIFNVPAVPVTQHNEPRIPSEMPILDTLNLRDPVLTEKALASIKKLVTERNTFRDALILIAREAHLVQE